MSRTLAIGDIHGCSAALDLLLRLVAPSLDDIVITLGDYVDRGPDSKGVLERLLILESAVHLVPLLGNHDEMMLEARGGGGLDWQAGYGETTIASYGGDLGQIPEAHWRFLERCRDLYETTTHVFAHASIEPHVELEQQTTYVLRWKSLQADAAPHARGRRLSAVTPAKRTADR